MHIRRWAAPPIQQGGRKRLPQLENPIVSTEYKLSWL
jgi:hypothetical protein